jgi:hypothetical protein
MPLALSHVGMRSTPVHVNVTQFHADGYVVVPNIFDPAEIDALRAGIIQNKRKAGAKFSMLGPLDPGVTIPDFLSRGEFRFMHHLPHHRPLRHALHQVFGGAPYRFCSHNDIGVNRVVSWHKDRLNDEYRHYQQLPLWGPGSEGPDGGHFIVKALSELTATAPAGWLRRGLADRGLVAPYVWLRRGLAAPRPGCAAAWLRRGSPHPS